MKIELLKGTPKPLDNALIVCAGTVTCKSVAEMGSGFNFFKKYFGGSKQSSSSGHYTWEDDLNQKLTNYHSHGQTMPLYCRIAKQDHDQGTYFGGVATVACNPKDQQQINPSHIKMKFADLKQQYKEAVRLAIQDALDMKRPLYMQPLGIGVYGWDPQLGAHLFAEVLAEFDKTNLHIQIPIYNQAPHSPDQQFAQQLQLEINQGLHVRLRHERRYNEDSTEQCNQVYNPNTPIQFNFILKCSVYCQIVSAALLVTSLLAMLSIISLTATTTTLLATVGIVSGGAAFYLFRDAKQAQDNESDTVRNLIKQS